MPSAPFPQRSRKLPVAASGTSARSAAAEAAAGSAPTGPSTAAEVPSGSAPTGPSAATEVPAGSTTASTRALAAASSTRATGRAPVTFVALTRFRLRLGISLLILTERAAHVVRFREFPFFVTPDKPFVALVRLDELSFVCH